PEEETRQQRLGLRLEAIQAVHEDEPREGGDERDDERQRDDRHGGTLARLSSVRLRLEVADRGDDLAGDDLERLDCRDVRDAADRRREPELSEPRELLDDPPYVFVLSDRRRCGTCWSSRSSRSRASAYRSAP